MKKIATAAIAVFSCLIFLSPTATPPRVHASEYRSDCLYVYTCEPTLTDDDFRQAGGSIPDRLPIAPSEFYGALQQGIFEPNDRLYFILEMDGLYTDDTTLANQFIQWRDKGVCIMLITHYDERLIGDNMEPDDIRIDYMNYANVFLCLDVFYDFATDVLANTIIDTQRFNDESWIDKTTNKTAFNGTIVLDKFFTDYMPAEKTVDYFYIYNYYWRIKHSAEYPSDTQLWRHSLCEVESGWYMKKSWYDYNERATEANLWNNRTGEPILDTPYFFVRSVKPLNRSMQAEVETAEDLGISYWDYTFTTDPGESGYLPSEEDFRQMKNDYLYAFFSGEDIPHEPK